VLYTFLKTGLRKSELINLNWKDIDFRRKYITIESKEDWRTKTGNTREIPVGDDLMEILNKLPRTSDYVFINSNGRKYGFHLTERVKRLAKNIGIADMTVHALRHTFISHLVMNGVDLVSVKELAGHSDIKTTMRYAHLAPGHLSLYIYRTFKLLRNSREGFNTTIVIKEQKPRFDLTLTWH
jgi:integrase